MKTRKEVEKAQRELNKLVGKTQTPKEFDQAVSERMSRILSAPPKKSKKTVNKSLFEGIQAALK